MKNSKLLVLIGTLILFLNGCSSEYLNTGYSRPSTNSLPKIPELDTRVIKRATPKVVKVKPYKPVTNRYKITSATRNSKSQREVELAKDNDRIILMKKGQSSVVEDPYASIPETADGTNNTKKLSSTDIKSSNTQTSPAVIALMARARADLSIGKTQSAISKLERGLRIESQNPNIWHLLAKAQYDQSNHQQAITMAKKSIRYADNDKLIAQNWKLIKKSGEKSDDAIVIKEALDYFKVNP